MSGNAGNDRGAVDWGELLRAYDRAVPGGMKESIGLDTKTAPMRQQKAPGKDAFVFFVNCSLRRLAKLVLLYKLIMHIYINYSNAIINYTANNSFINITSRPSKKLALPVNAFLCELFFSSASPPSFSVLFLRSLLSPFPVLADAFLPP